MKPARSLPRRNDPFRVIAWCIVTFAFVALAALAILTARDNSRAATAAEESFTAEDARVSRQTSERQQQREQWRIDDAFRREGEFNRKLIADRERQERLNRARRDLKEAEESLKDQQRRSSPNDPSFD